jgi:serine/threonine protein kinase
VVQLLGGNFVKGRAPFLVYELMDGCLPDLLGTQCPSALRLSLLRDVFRACVSLQCVNLVHCEIKEDNVLVKDGRAYLSDFGHRFEQTATLTDLEASSEPKGTHYWVSPERGTRNSGT